MKKTVFLTGSSGNMGFAAFKELYARRHMYHIVLLNRDSKKNRFEAIVVKTHKKRVLIFANQLTPY